MRSQYVRFLAVAGAVAAASAGCASPRAALGTTQSTCFPALAAAADAVGHQGDFAGLRRMSLTADQGLPFPVGPRPVRPQHGTAPAASSTMAPTGTPAPATSSTLAPAATRAPSTTSAAQRVHAVCLVAFKGTFEPALIPLLRGPSRTGSYAVVIVGLRTHQARAVYLTDHLPRAFSHL